MAEPRWRLFVHEVQDLLHFPHESGGMVVVLADNGLDFIDVVSRNNFAGIAYSDDGRFGIIASYVVNRVNEHSLHRQRFTVSVNDHVCRAANKWSAELRADAGDDASYAMHQWLVRRVLRGDLNNPEIAMLRQNMIDVNERLKLAEDGPAEERNRLFDEHEKAVAALIDAVARA